MACFHPIPAAKRGSRVRFYPPLGETDFWLPCGSCLGCVQDRSLDWSIRAIHESLSHQHNAFVTLTYDDAHLPKDGQLWPLHLTAFWKDLRRALEKPTPGLAGDRIRYLAAGEYGDQMGRPHYHACIFGLEIRDGIPVAKDLWRSDALAKIWGHGFISWAPVTPKNARYVAQYTLKKLGVAPPCDSDGVVTRRPFLRASLRPGLGAQYLRQYASDFSQGYAVTLDGRKCAVPRYYLKLLEREFPDLHETASEARAEKRKPPDAYQLASRERMAEQRQSHNQRKRKNRGYVALHGL